MNFDEWAGNIKEQMERKGHGFDPAERYHSAALLGLVTSEIVEAEQEIKRHHLQQPDAVAGELADALIRIGHFAATVGVRFETDLRFEGLLSLNDLGDQHRSEDVVDLSDLWRVLCGVMWLIGGTHALFVAWNNGRLWMPEARNGNTMNRFGISLRRCVIEICAMGRLMGLDLDAAMDRRIAHNETRPVGYNLAATANG